MLSYVSGTTFHALFHFIFSAALALCAIISPILMRDLKTIQVKEPDQGLITHLTLILEVWVD